MLLELTCLILAAQKKDTLKKLIIIDTALLCSIFDLPFGKLQDSQGDDRPWYKARICSSEQSFLPVQPTALIS